MVEVFRTNVDNQSEADALVRKIREVCIDLEVNFDLQDCDRILRVEGDSVDAETVIEILRSERYQCAVLEDTPSTSESRVHERLSIGTNALST